ncbi:MAG: metallophosphoesterase [Sulfolobaceae archaeon]
MLALATSDIHSPIYLDLFIKSYMTIPKNDINLVLLAGDLTDKGKYWNFDPIYGLLKKYKVVAVFGNEDFHDVRNKYIQRYKEIIWLQDELYEDVINGVKISIVGSDGVLERPTKWQIVNGFDENYYREKLRKIEELLCKSKGDIKILLTHYSTTFETLVGENKRIYPELGYKLIESVSCKPDISIHGHAHYSKRTYYKIGKTRVYNVALPANQRIVMVNLMHS